MSKKLTSAQERVLLDIRDIYFIELRSGKEFYTKELQCDKTLYMKKYDQECLNMYNNGYILWRTSNSKTLCRLEYLGYIDYIERKKIFEKSPRLDWVRLKFREE